MRKLCFDEVTLMVNKSSRGRMGRQCRGCDHVTTVRGEALARSNSRTTSSQADGKVPGEWPVGEQPRGKRKRWPQREVDVK